MPEMDRRVAFVAHCLVNQNAKVSEFAKCAGVVAPLVERLRANGYEIQQLPCPEMSYLGVGGSDRKAGMGVWMTELKYEFESRGMAFPRATGIAMDAQNFDMEASMMEMDKFLAARKEPA